MWTENLYKRMLDVFFTPAFRSISLTRCVSIGRYYDTVHDYKHYGDIQVGNYERAEMAEKNYKHLRLIMERLSLSVSEDKEGTENDALFRPTIFEEELPRLMVSEYNRVAETVGAVLAPVGYCHYMLEDKQSWIKPESEDNRVYAFTEHVIIACLDCALSYSAIAKLNTQISEGQIRRARGRFKNVKAVLNSPVFYNAIVKTFFDLVVERHEERFQTIEKSFEKLERKIDKRKRKQYYHDKVDVELSDSEMMQYVDNEDYLYIGGIFYGCICPLAELMLTKKMPMDLIDDANDDWRYLDLEENHTAAAKIISTNCLLNNNAVSVEEYVFSRKTAKLVAGYLASVLEDVVGLLECLPEAQIIGKGSFRSWYKNLKA